MLTGSSRAPCQRQQQEKAPMPDITIKRYDGWWYCLVNGQRERFGYSTVAGAIDRYYAIVEGWI
jgi:hypothetical protein